jgi:hypothetical protein
MGIAIITAAAVAWEEHGSALAKAGHESSHLKQQAEAESVVMRLGNRPLAACC